MIFRKENTKIYDLIDEYGVCREDISRRFNEYMESRWNWSWDAIYLVGRKFMNMAEDELEEYCSNLNWGEENFIHSCSIKYIFLLDNPIIVLNYCAGSLEYYEKHFGKMENRKGTDEVIFGTCNFLDKLFDGYENSLRNSQIY